jgi:class 3 adenylate cyclase
MQVLREYHGAVGPLIFRYEATLEHFAGDGIVSFFNDPVPCPDPAARAVRMAVEMQCEVGRLVERWSRRGHDLALGLGLATGYATMGQIGFESLFHYPLGELELRGLRKPMPVYNVTGLKDGGS